MIKLITLLRENKFSEYSNDALKDMIINLSRFEDNEELIASIKDELERRKNKMIKLAELLNEGPQIGELPVKQYKLVQGKEAELAKIKNPKVIDYIKKNPNNINLRDLAKFLSTREQAALQFINVLKQAGALEPKAMAEATFTKKYDDSPKLKGKQKTLPDEIQAKIVTEDHEVSMATASLKSIIKSSVTLLNKLGNMERDIPGWIQDHITNAENYIDQAAQGFHELNDNN